MRVTLPSLWGRDTDPYEGFRREFEDLWRDFGRRGMMPWSRDEPMATPALDVAESKAAVEIMTELPGVAEADVSVTVEGQSIVISGEKKSEKETKDKSWHVVERSYGSFRRVVPLTFSPDAEKVKAAFEKGVLHVTVEKPAELVAKKVSVPIAKAK